MGKWRTMFEANLPPVDERTYGEQYDFAPPATEEQLATAESALGTRFPADVREMLSEFNGIWRRTKFGGDPSIQYLDLHHMTVAVPEYFRTCGNELPPKKDLRKIVFVCQFNGFGDLWGVCVSDVAGHRAGEVVKLDHEVGELEASHPSLAEFVRRGPK
ncbi:MAG TPA: SMI1/KNR4 family protein [Gemmataceae bacterium]|jgi:hypothetical protein